MHNDGILFRSLVDFNPNVTIENFASGCNASLSAD